MTVEIFTKDEFEDVLSDIAQKLEVPLSRDGLVSGEYEYHFVVKTFKNDHKILVKVRSSIGQNGESAAGGQDSIRVWLTVDDERVGNKTQHWVTRVPGWRDRLIKGIADLAAVARKVELCPDCQEIPGVFVVKKDSPNKGRWFSSCWKHDHFTWLSDSVIDSRVPTCPKCGAGMVKRSGQYGDFWGCSRYPNCRGTRPYVKKGHEADKAPELAASSGSNRAPLPQAVPLRKFVPSEFQVAIFDFVKNGKSNAVVEAVAGSGKTTTIVKALEFTDPSSDVAFVAFNRHIAKELAEKVPRHVRVSTLHSLGYTACRQAYGANLLVEPDKVGKILERVLDKFIYGNKFPAVRHLVSLVKANLVDISDENLDDLSLYYGVELNESREIIYAAVKRVIKKSYDQRRSVIDFDDMCWLPVVDHLPVKKIDFLFVDEAQDLNKNQIELVLMHLKKNGGRVVAVGDRHQSLYGFRGADTEAIPNLIEALKAEVLPLNISYRCPKSHVRMAQNLVPDIRAADWAIEGVVRDVSGDMLTLEAIPGDMVLCRTNAPLIRPCFALIRRGVKAVIRGRDIGKGLQVLIRGVKATGIEDLMAKLAAYKTREMSKLLAAEKSSLAQVLQDKVDTVIALADGVETVMDLSFHIDQVFSDDVGGVVFSSIHRAKGLEADRVFILRPDLMPHPMAKYPWELVQERNVKYVAYTRSKSELAFVR